MCRHCERIQEHPEDRPIVHAFMERTAQRLSDRIGEVVTADQLDISISLVVYDPPVNERLAQEAYRFLRELDR